MIDACDACLRRALLVARLAPRIAGLLERPASRVAGVLGLSEEDLVSAVAGPRAAEVHAFLRGLDAERVRAELGAREVISLCLHADRYPPGLRDLADPPAVLFGLGRLEALGALRDQPVVAIVGTRNPSPYGVEVALALGRGLGASGVPVVSGLALGIDGTAHRGCLAGAGVPIAVLACGPDWVYPRRHQHLHDDVRRAGIVVSELPPGTRPLRWSFPARNRIMAALARVVVVVEAAEPSGSLITADFARDLGRAVAAVPGRVTSRVSRGTNNLLRDGAVPVTGTEDVLDELFGVGVRAPPPSPVVKPEPADRRLRDTLDAVERIGSVDGIARELGLPTSEARAAIGRLEAEGFLSRRDLGGWERAAG